MSFGTIKRPLTLEEQRAILATVEEKLRAEAARAKIADPIIRDLLPGDLTNPDDPTVNNVWRQSVSADAYRVVYSGKNPNDRIFAIFGVKSRMPVATYTASGYVEALFPRTTAIRFWEGTTRTALKDIWQLEDGWTEENRVIYSPVPVIYKESEGFNIDLYARSSGTDEIILLGKVVEPRNKVIAPRGK